MYVTERYPGENAREYAYRMLTNNIVSMELTPGSLIREQEIAAAIGVSRTPVSAAVADLAKSRIIEVLPQRGLRVAMIDYGLIEEAVFMRRVLELAVVELACRDAAPEDVSQLRQNVHMQQYNLARDRSELMDLDSRFHKKLFQIARKESIYSMVKQMTIHFDRVRSVSMYVVKDMKIVADHEHLVDALEAHDVQMARSIMEEHLSRYKVDSAAIRQAYPDWIQD